MAYKSGLGKGLDALIPIETPSPEKGDFYIPVNKIIPNPRQPRQAMEAETLADLSASIREHGILQPLIVTHEPGTDVFTLIAGERRLRAAIMAGLESVPALVRSVTDQQRLEMALIENVQRADLTPMETAEAYRQLTEDFKLSHEEVAAQVGKSRVAVTNTLRLLHLPEAIQTAISRNQISEGHARALLALNAPQAQLAVLQTILKQELNVRQTEELVRKMGGEKIKKTSRSEPAAEVVALENRLRDALGTRVSLHHGRKGGSIVIHYYSDEELNSLVSRFTRG